jgi:acyl-CoA reductase-like NAD-dependent aldehyde dehydrogenase
VDRYLHWIDGSVRCLEPHACRSAGGDPKPFGGDGDSGSGREGPEYDMEAMTEWKWISLQLRPTR